MCDVPCEEMLLQRMKEFVPPPPAPSFLFDEQDVMLGLKVGPGGNSDQQHQSSLELLPCDICAWASRNETIGALHSPGQSSITTIANNAVYAPEDQYKRRFGT
jgi:hypothetical protein